MPAEQETTRYRLEVYPTNPAKPLAIWDGMPGRGRLVANLRDAEPTLREAGAMLVALNAAAQPVT